MVFARELMACVLANIHILLHTNECTVIYYISLKCILKHLKHLKSFLSVLMYILDQYNI